MNLTYLFQQQKILQEQMNHPMGKGIPSVNQNALALIREVAELLDELPSKPWHKDSFVPDKTACTYELVDILMFYANIANELDITAEEIVQAYSKKLLSAFARFVPDESKS